MGWKEFIADIVGSLTWPAAIAFIAFLLRKQLAGLIESLRALRYKGLEAVWAASPRSRGSG
jgi:hypothetical protein